MPVINKSFDDYGKVKFISYTGSWPCLCVGVLTLEINGEKYRFGSSHIGGDLPPFWTTGGSCGFTENYSNSYVTSGPWIIDESMLPDELKKYSSEIDTAFNDNVPFGCCGGCL